MAKRPAKPGKTHVEKVGTRAVSPIRQQDEAHAVLAEAIAGARSTFNSELGEWVHDNVGELKDRDMKVVAIATSAEALFDLRIKKEVKREHVPDEELRAANTTLHEAIEGAKIRRTPKAINDMITGIFREHLGMGKE